MCQVLVPTSVVVNPLEPRDYESSNDILESGRFNYLDLEGDYPRNFGGNGNNGGGSYSPGGGGGYAPGDVEPGPIPENPGWERLDAILNNVLTQDWKERGNPGNPRILECYRACNLSYTRDSSEMAYAWCSAFVSWVLVTAGLPSNRTMSSQGWGNYGGEVNWRDTSQIRKWDIVVFKSKTRSGGHIGFIKEITSNGTIKVLGGNQGNDAKISNYSFNSDKQYVKHVKRNWALPPEADVSIDGTAAAQAGNDSTV